MRLRHPLTLIPVLLLVCIAFIAGIVSPGIGDPPTVTAPAESLGVTSPRRMSHPPIRSENRKSRFSEPSPRDVSRGDPFGALPSIEDIAAAAAHLDEVMLLEARVIERDEPRDEPREEPPPPAAPTPPPPAPGPPPAAGSVEEIICARFVDNCDQALAVARCESTLQPGAISPGGGNWGLFQINTVHRARVAAHGYTWDQVLDPHVNTEIAHALWAEQGWGPWTCARNLGIR